MLVSVVVVVLIVKHSILTTTTQPDGFVDSCVVAAIEDWGSSETIRMPWKLPQLIFGLIKHRWRDGT